MLCDYVIVQEIERSNNYKTQMRKIMSKINTIHLQTSQLSENSIGLDDVTNLSDEDMKSFAGGCRPRPLPPLPCPFPPPKNKNEYRHYPD